MFFAAVALVAFTATSAFAWDVQGLDRKIRIERASTDATGTVKIYFSGTQVTNTTAMANGTWDTVPTTAYYTIVFDSNDRVFEASSGSFTAALVTTPGGDNAAIALSRLAVYLVDPSTGAYPYTQPVSVSSMPPVNVASSVSVDGTLPVSVESLLGESDGRIMWALFGGLLAFAAWEAVEHLTNGREASDK